MAILWEKSGIPFIDENGDPRFGARAFFFDANTSTPLTTYTEASLSIPHDHPVVANGDGVFPAVFLPPQILYRIRIEDSTGVTLSDIDGISTPPVAIPAPPEGDTPLELLFQTGDIKMAWRSSAPNGWVRLNGRTIGSGASAATERANDDCSNLFAFIWNNDSNLAVSGGRGASAAGDWAAAKTIALPDFRGRAPIAPDSFGSAAANIVTDANLGSDSDLLGAKGGASSVTLTVDQMPSHTHTGTTSSDGAHAHQMPFGDHSGTDGGPNGAPARYVATPVDAKYTTASDGDHTHTFTTASTGSGDAHNNLQPSIVVPFFIKL